MLTVAEAAQELGVSVRAVQNRIRAGEMEAEKVTPRLYLIPRSEVERWKPIGKRKGGRPRKEPTVGEYERAEAEHDDALDLARRRIRGEADEEQPS